MLLGNQQQTNINNSSEQNDEWIVQLLSNNQYVEAYRLMKSEPPKKLSTLFNSAICMLFIEEYEQCLHSLDEALAKLQPKPADNSPKEDRYRKLERMQSADSSYLQGITDRYVRHFPDMVKNNILRVKIDCYRALSQWSKVLELAAQLGSQNYLNVENAVDEAQAHIK